MLNLFIVVINGWKWLLSALHVKRIVNQERQEGIQLGEGSAEYNTGTIDPNQMKLVAATYYEGEIPQNAMPAAYSSEMAQQEIENEGTGYEYVDEYGNVLYYDPFYFVCY